MILSIMTSRARLRLKQGIYITTLVLIIGFLVKQGKDPWLAALKYWPVMLGTILLTPFTLVVQVITFRYCVPQDHTSTILPLSKLIRIWAIAAISSIVAPFIAGLAVRVTLLKQEGLEIRLSSIATVRQTLVNVEYAWVIAAGLLLFYPWINFPLLGYIMATAWAMYKLLAIFMPTCQSFTPRFLKESYKKYLKYPVTFKLPRKAKIWFLGQIIIMSINYSFAFWLGGAFLVWHKSLLLTSATIISSLLIFIPHGFGVLDSLWVWIASQQGLSMGQGVALAITMRLGMFIGYGLVYIILSFWDFRLDLDN